MEALSRRLDLMDESEGDGSREAASAIRELVCANAKNRSMARTVGIIPKLCERIRMTHCVDAIGALRNLAANTHNAAAAGELGAIEILVDVIRAHAREGTASLEGDDKRVVFAAASAMRSLCLNDVTNARRVSRATDVLARVTAVCDGMEILEVGVQVPVVHVVIAGNH